MDKIYQDAIHELLILREDSDTEMAHIHVDAILCDLLLEMGCPTEVVETYNSIGKWYA